MNRHAITVTSTAVILLAAAGTTVTAATTNTVTREVASSATPAGRPAFHAQDARYGITGSRSVTRLKQRLRATANATGALKRQHITGTYNKATRASVARVQRRLGYTGKNADGILGPSSAAHLGLRWIPVATPAPAPTPQPGASGTSRRALTGHELVDVLTRAGFTEPSIRTAWAIAMRESRGTPSAVSQANTNGTRDHGLFQINDIHRGTYDFTTIYNADANAAIAYRLSAGGTDFSAWAIGDKGWAGHLKRTAPNTWAELNRQVDNWKTRYPQ